MCQRIRFDAHMKERKNLTPKTAVKKERVRVAQPCRTSVFGTDNLTGVHGTIHCSGISDCLLTQIDQGRITPDKGEEVLQSDTCKTDSSIHVV